MEGPNDVIALDTLGVPAVALCSNTISQAQVAKLVGWAEHLSGGTVTILFDCDEEGERGAKQALLELVPHCRVRLAWSSSIHDGQFRGRQPESVTRDEWEVISRHLHGSA